MQKKKLILIVGIIIMIVCGGVFLTLQPTNDRNWNNDQAVLPYAVIKNEQVEIKNIRNFTYASTTSYTPAYYDKTFSLQDLQSVDYIVEPFNSIGAAHTFLSFGFTDGSYVAISVEIRKEVGETFSAWKGLLRQYELMYVIADERDVIELRTNHRKDEVFVYPVATTQEKMQALFLSMLNRANQLKEKPEFYNTLTSNCTTNIVAHINTLTAEPISWDYRFLLPADSDIFGQELGLIAQGLSIEEARAKYRVNEAALQYAEDENFSQLIRGINPATLPTRTLHNESEVLRLPDEPLDLQVRF